MSRGRAVRRERGELADERVYRTTEGERAFAPGDRLLFRENNRELGVKNGMLATVERTHGVGEAEGDRLVVRLDSPEGPGQGRVVSVSMADYAAVDHGYATTIHKAQGATVDRAYVLASGTMDRHLTYVSMTRHRDSVQIYADRSEFSDVGALSARLSRSQAKETTLDYDRATYAERRGMESEIVVPAQAIASGRAAFRQRYEAHQQRQAADAARDEKARDLAHQWDRLMDEYTKALPGLEVDPALGGTRARLLQFGRTLRAHPEAATALRQRGPAFGVGERSDLARVLADQQPERAITSLMERAETEMRGHLALEAAREVARKQREQTLSRDRGMSL